MQMHCVDDSFVFFKNTKMPKRKHINSHLKHKSNNLIMLMVIFYLAISLL